MVFTDLVEWALHELLSLAGVSGLQVGLLAILLVAGYHLRHILHFLQRALGALKIASGVGVLMGVLFVVALSFGVVDVSGNVQMLIEGVVGVGRGFVDAVQGVVA